MSDPFLGEIRMTAFSFAPRGWALCNGQLLNIAQQSALFSLLGTTYGGNGVTTFGLPNLQARMPMHASSNHPLGETGGQALHVLTSAEIPTHTHNLYATSDKDSSFMVTSPAGAMPVDCGKNAFATQKDSAGLCAASGIAGASQGHENMPPYTVINFIICTIGSFPSRN
jgi:microcystin-dependent protein